MTGVKRVSRMWPWLWAWPAAACLLAVGALPLTLSAAVPSEARPTTPMRVRTGATGTPGALGMSGNTSPEGQPNEQLNEIPTMATTLRPQHDALTNRPPPATQSRRFPSKVTDEHGEWTKCPPELIESDRACRDGKRFGYRLEPAPVAAASSSTATPTPTTTKEGPHHGTATATITKKDLPTSSLASRTHMSTVDSEQSAATAPGPTPSRIPDSTPGPAPFADAATTTQRASAVTVTSAPAPVSSPAGRAQPTEVPVGVASLSPGSSASSTEHSSVAALVEVTNAPSRSVDHQLVSVPVSQPSVISTAARVSDPTAVLTAAPAAAFTVVPKVASTATPTASTSLSPTFTPTAAPKDAATTASIAARTPVSTDAAAPAVRSASSTPPVASVAASTDAPAAAPTAAPTTSPTDSSFVPSAGVSTGEPRGSASYKMDVTTESSSIASSAPPALDVHDKQPIVRTELGSTTITTRTDSDSAEHGGEVGGQEAGVEEEEDGAGLHGDVLEDGDEILMADQPYLVEAPHFPGDLDAKLGSLDCAVPQLPPQSILWRTNQTHELELPLMVSQRAANLVWHSFTPRGKEVSGVKQFMLSNASEFTASKKRSDGDGV